MPQGVSVDCASIGSRLIPSHDGGLEVADSVNGGSGLDGSCRKRLQEFDDGPVKVVQVRLLGTEHHAEPGTSCERLDDSSAFPRPRMSQGITEPCLPTGPWQEAGAGSANDFSRHEAARWFFVASFSRSNAASVACVWARLPRWPMSEASDIGRPRHCACPVVT